MALTKQEWVALENKAADLRSLCADTIFWAGSGHLGGSFSSADLLTILYYKYMNFDPKHYDDPDRDRMVVSKGHIGVILAPLFAQMGLIDPEDLKTFNLTGSKLGIHLDSNKVKGLDTSTGSLGHGSALALGLALAARVKGKDYKTFLILGDGECDEGSVWEAALFANHYRLDNLVAIVDHNHMQSLDYCEKTLELEDFAAKWRAFGWNAIELDGHDHDALRCALKDTSNTAGKPTVIIANTVKGRGVSFMENDILWHYRFPHDGWEYDGAVTELHAAMPEGVTDPYTPNGIADPIKPEEGADIGNDHTTSAGWHPSYF